MQLMKASQQWSQRPPDERFWDLQALYTATRQHREAARTATVDTADLRVEAREGDIQLIGKTGQTAELTHWSFGQLSARANAPASYLRQLPATLAVQNLNYGLKARADHSEAKLLLHENGGSFARAITSGKYTRIWNSDIVQKLLRFEAEGWRTPPAYATHMSAVLGKTESEDALQNALISGQVRRATAEDAKWSLSIEEGDLIGPAGLYASFEDMFVFLIHPEKVVRDGTPDGLIRGFLVWNSEVGKQTFGVQTFYFRGACGNHVIFGAQDVKEINLRHVGNADDRAFQGLEVELTKYANTSASEDEAKIELARKFVLKGKTKEEVIDAVFGMRILTRTDAVKAYEAVIEDVDGPAYTAWGFSQGITRLSQTIPNADKRVEYDRAAGKLIEVAF
jgi:hypothetical protein